jgi:hypothetical protein
VYDVFLPLISEQLEALCAVQRGGFFSFSLTYLSHFLPRASHRCCNLPCVPNEAKCETSGQAGSSGRFNDPMLCSWFYERVKPVYFLDCISLLMLHLSQHVSFVLLSQVRQISDVVFILVFALGFNWQLVSGTYFCYCTNH